MEKTLHRKEYRILLRLLTQARKSADITQVDLAERLQVPRSTISKWETGEQRLDLLEFWSWCQVMGVDPVALIQSFQAEWKGSGPLRKAKLPRR